MSASPTVTFGGNCVRVLAEGQVQPIFSYALVTVTRLDLTPVPEDNPAAQDAAPADAVPSSPRFTG